MKPLKKRNMDGELITLQMAAELINSSRETARKLAQAAGAVRRLGRSYRIKRSVFVDYIEKSAEHQRD